MPSFCSVANAPPCRPAIVLTCPRWHRVLHATPSLWRWYSVSAPQMADRQWGTEQQEAWLAAKLRQLRRVSPAVECLTVVNTAGVDVLADMLNCLSPGRLAEIYASDYREPVTPAAMRALAGFGGLPQLEAVSIGSTIHALPANSSWAVGQLTALCSLCLHSSSFPADLPAMLCRLSDLEKLDITSRERLPDVQPLTALGQLRELALQEAWSQPQDGLAVLPATAFKSGTQLYFESTYLKVRSSICLC